MHFESALEAYGRVVPSGRQFSAFLATAWGLKPAMDLWVDADLLPSLADLIDSFRCVMYVDASMERLAEDQRSAWLSPTTQARWELAGERHVFVARDPEALADAVRFGWYPVLVGCTPVGRPWLHRRRFGDALGYPTCCTSFFEVEDDWRTGSLLSKVAPGSEMLVHGLARQRTLAPIFHHPCSYACSHSVELAVRHIQHARLIGWDDYADAVLDATRGVFLVMSEQVVFRLNRPKQVGLTTWRCDGAEVIELLPGDHDHLPTPDLLRSAEAVQLIGRILTVTSPTEHYSEFIRVDEVHPVDPLILDFRLALPSAVAGSLP